MTEKNESIDGLDEMHPYGLSPEIEDLCATFQLGEDTRAILYDIYNRGIELREEMAQHNRGIESQEEIAQPDQRPLWKKILFGDMK